MRYAVLDLDETLIEGSVGYVVTRWLLDPRKGGRYIPRKYYIKMMRYIHIPILTPFKRFYRIYRYLLHKTYQIYMKLLSDPSLPKHKILYEMKRAVESIKIPKESLDFIKRLKERGYTVVLLTATPQEIAEVMGKRLGVDIVIGSRQGEVMDRENKERVIRELEKSGSVDIIVGNPKYEPFHLARRYAIVVRSPRDLRRWIDKL